MKIFKDTWRLKAIRHRKSGAFTLIELLLVVVIIGILIAVTTPYIIGAITASRLTSAGEQLTSMFSLANQMASSEGRAVEIKLLGTIDKEDPDKAVTFRTVFILRRYEAGEASPDVSQGAVALQKPLSLITGDVLRLPEGIVIAATADGSSVMKMKSAGDGLAPKQIKNGVVQDYIFQDEIEEQVSIVFNPDGTNLGPADKWYVTLAEQSEILKSVNTPATWKNFFCIQVDPVNARVTSYRP